MSEYSPSIKVYVNSEFHELELLNSVLWGIEEEGIPYEIIKSQEKSALKLAYNAALSSRLDVGIGVGADGSIMMHYAKLNENSPLYKFSFRDNKNILRMLGSNAARLVKSMPFKTEKDYCKESFKEEKENVDEEYIAKLAAEIIRKMKL